MWAGDSVPSAVVAFVADRPGGFLGSGRVFDDALPGGPIDLIDDRRSWHNIVDKLLAFLTLGISGYPSSGECYGAGSADVTNTQPLHIWTWG
jgi:hypothetical protein